jgi:hypothetical protein
MSTTSSPAKTAGTQTGDSCLVVLKGKEVSLYSLKTKRFWALLIESGKKIATTKEEKIASIEE